jgi:hypothetical protein
VQIATNTTGMAAALTVASDKDGRDHCVVVVKGTFAIGEGGETRLAEEQEPLVYTDVHWGEPGTSGVRYECDFALEKPRVDILVNGTAFAPGGRAVDRLTVGVEIAGGRKELSIVGDRHFYVGALGMASSPPAPFVTMPITFDRAFGGIDATHPDRAAAELRNLAGRGFWKYADRKRIDGTPLPNVEHPHHPLRAPGDTPPPAGFGVIARGWQPRIGYAGTYDQRWLDEKFPFLPDDFDPQHFQAAPADQQVSALRGGESIRCTNMTPEGVLETAVPRAEVPVELAFRDRKEVAQARLDTLLIEPDRRRMMLTFRASVPLGRKLNALREVIVGKRPLSPAQRVTRETVEALPRGRKPHFASLEEFIAWKRGQMKR